MKNNSTSCHIQTKSISDLTSEAFAEFLENGFLIQRPFSQQIWLGINAEKSKDGPLFISTFYKTKFLRLKPQYLVQTTIEEFLEYCSQSQVLGDERLSINEVENSDDIFSKDLAKIKTWFIDDQNLKKLVAVTTSRYKLKNKAHPLSQIKAMINLPGSIYGQWKDGKGVIGVSPEPLFVKEKNGWRTRSLAGTISTDESQYKQKLLGDPKEKNEHDLVISDIVHKMKPFAKTIKTGSTTVEAYGKIAHLQTEIFFEAEYLSSEKIVQLLSPTAALGGYPQSLSQRYLQDLGYFNEAGENRYFGGVMGLDFEDESFGLVGIRNFYWDHHQQQGIIHSGCGVVRQSDPQLELLEVKKKRNVITRLFDQ